MGERMKSSLLLRRWARVASVIAALVLLGKGAAFAAPVEAAGGEANLKLPDLTQVHFFGMNGHSLLMFGPLFCILGMIFGLFMYVHLKGLPAHRSMKEVSQLIWETCKTYLINQGKFLLLLWSLHCGRHPGLLRRAAALQRGSRDHHPRVQRAGDGGQLLCGVVRHPGEYAGEFALRVGFAGR